MSNRESERSDDRWASLPPSIKPEETTTTHAVAPGADSTPEVDLERYWAAQEQG